MSVRGGGARVLLSYGELLLVAGVEPLMGAFPTGEYNRPTASAQC